MRFDTLLDRKPSLRCAWIDQLRGWAVIVMIEVHCVNVWLARGLAPDWLHYLNGLVAPSFIACAGYSLALSTYRPDGSLRPFPPTAKRLGFILLCAYALHAPGYTLAEWTWLSTPQKFYEFFKIDVLQCIVYSLLILHGLARLIRRPRVFAGVALALALGAALAAPLLWRPGVAQGWWLPIRGLFNGNTDRGVTALFPLFPWFSFAAFGAVLGALYRELRVLPRKGGAPAPAAAEDGPRALWSEGRWLAALGLLGGALILAGSLPSLLGLPTLHHQDPLHKATLASVIQRLGFVCAAGALLGLWEALRPRRRGPDIVGSASRESLLLYMLHLNLIFTVLLSEPLLLRTGWDWYGMGWGSTLLLTAAIIAVNLLAGLGWQKARKVEGLAPRLQRMALVALAFWFFGGGWTTYFHYRTSPELAQEPYPFLNRARKAKGLPPTPDGLCRDPEEYFREAQRRRIALDPAAMEARRQQILARGPALVQ